MAEKTASQSSSSVKITIVACIAILMCCGEFVRIEVLLNEQNMKWKRFEDKMDEIVSSTANKRDSLGIKEWQTSNEKKLEELHLIVRRSVKDTPKQNKTQENQTKERLTKLIDQRIRKAVSTLQMARYWIPASGPPGPQGKQGEKGLKGDQGGKGRRGPQGQPGIRGKMGPRGLMGDPGINGASGPRGMPGPKGDPGLSLSAPSVIISPPKLIVNKSQSAIFHCSASGYPRPIVVWSKVNGLLPPSAIIDDSGKLQIKHVATHDSGVYQCKASNILGKAQRVATLEVNFPPQINLTKDQIYKKTGSDVILPKCHVTGNPKPKITWSKAIGTLPQSRTHIKDGELTLSRVNKHDSGSYLCQAVNPLGAATSGLVLVVLPLPVFIMQPKSSYTVSFGSRLTLGCKAKGDPRPVITWTKENGFLPVGRYEVKLDGTLILRDLRKTDSGVYVCTATSAGVSDISVKTKVSFSIFKDCSDIYKIGERRDGVYTVQPDGQGAFQVYCDMTTDGGGWTVFQRRKDGTVDFYRNWQDYKTGFGNLNGEFWLGNDYIHRLTKTTVHLRVELEDWVGNEEYAKYGSFSIGDEADKYRLTVGSYSGSAGDSLSWHKNMFFSTNDRDNDVYRPNCAVDFRGAWWYKDCHRSNLNGKYLGNLNDCKGVRWQWFQDRNDCLSLKTAEMKIKP